MEDAAPSPQAEPEIQHRLAQLAPQTDAAVSAVEHDELGRQVYTCLAYQYEPAVDRYGTTMQRGAMAHVQPEDFRILAYHDQRQDPVGKPISIEDTPEGPVVRWVFADTPRAQELRSLVDGGFLRAVSVGFQPDPKATTVRDGVTVFGRCDLLELSLVNTPASPGALIQLARDMNQDPAELRELFPEVAAEEPAAEEEREVEAEEAPAADALAAAVETLRAAGVSEEVLAQLVPVPAEEAEEREVKAEADPAAGQDEERRVRQAQMLWNLAVIRSCR